MNIGGISGGMSALSQPEISAPGPSGDGSFGRMVDNLLEKITQPQMTADQAVQDLAMGKTDNLHQVLLAVSQADVAFRLALEVRNRLTDAYQEIMRMQV